MTERELGHRVHLDSGTLAPLLRRLEGLGVLRRSRPENDERTLLLTLTEAGRAYIRAAMQIMSIEQDFQDTLRQCRPVTAESIRHEKLGYRLLGTVLKFIAPLL